MELVADWLTSLDEESRVQVIAAIGLLQSYGPQMGRPIVDTVKGSHHTNIKELRPGSSPSSKIERGNLESAQVGTIRRYLEAVGAH